MPRGAISRTRRTIRGRVADETAARSERFLGDFRATLETIAQRPLVRAMDPARCDPELSTLRELYPRAGNIIVVDAEGYIICGARPPPRGQRLRVADMELQNAVIRDGMFRLSQPLIGRISGTWGVTAVQPVRSEDGRVIGAVECRSTCDNCSRSAESIASRSSPESSPAPGP